MIQNYLKTGMVFYGGGSTTTLGQDQQHFRSACCKEIFYHYTDATHFPSFQFFISFPIRMPLELWFVRLIQYDPTDGSMTSLGNFGVLDFPVDVFHGTTGVWITHDYREPVVYPGVYNNTDMYYLQIRLRDARGPGGTVYWVSEAFKICNCDTEGVGDKINLIENDWFEDWFGTGDWHDYPLGWALTGESAGNLVEDAGGECRMISDGGAITILQTPLTAGNWYVATIDITGVAAGSVALYNNVAALVAWSTTGIKRFVFQATTTRIGLRRVGVMNVTFTNFRVEEFVGFKFCDMLTLNWWSDCDWDDIIYQDGYRNSLVLNTGLDNPSEDIVINPEERQGEMFVRDVIIKKRYKFTIRIPEYLWNALIRLPAYGSEMPNFHAWIVLPDGSTAPMSELAIMGDWDVGNCMNTFTIDFVDDHEYPVVATNCCDDEDYSEIFPAE